MKSGALIALGCAAAGVRDAGVPVELPEYGTKLLELAPAK